MADMLRDLAVYRQQLLAYDSLPGGRPPSGGRPLSGGHGRPSDPPSVRPPSDPASDAPTIAQPTTPFPSAAGAPRTPSQGGTPLPAVAALMPGRSPGWSELSPCLFAETLLQPALGMLQQEAEDRGYLAYTRDTADAIAAVRDGKQDLAFLLDGVPLQTMTVVAKAGERLPHKSTYFHPKLATGLVIRSLEGAVEGE